MPFLNLPRRIERPETLGLIVQLRELRPRRMMWRLVLMWRLVSLLLAVFFLAGCEGSGTLPQLVVSSVTTIQMPPDGASVPAPRSMTFDRDGQLYVLDNAGRVLVYAPSGKPLREWHMPEFDVGKPEGICVFHDGRIGVADTHYHRVVLFDADGKQALA